MCYSFVTWICQTLCSKLFPRTGKLQGLYFFACLHHSTNSYALIQSAEERFLGQAKQIVDQHYGPTASKGAFETNECADYGRRVTKTSVTIKALHHNIAYEQLKCMADTFKTYS